jgi:hypothetical protein
MGQAGRKGRLELPVDCTVQALLFLATPHRVSGREFATVWRVNEQNWG